VLRLLSIGLISLLLYQSAGFVVTFELGVSAIRKELKEKLIQKGEGSIVRLAFHQAARIDFKDDGKEIYHNRNMYDILRQETKGDSLIFSCFHDIAESELAAAFEDEINDITSQEQSRSKHNKATHKKYEYLQTLISITPGPMLTTGTLPPTLLEYQLSTLPLSILTPPPQLA
jgi:hypothetical protein